MNGHSPGPWQVVPEAQAESRWVIGDGEGGSIASCEPCGPWISPQEADANARLIAAAPELLEALKKAREYVAKVNGNIAGAIGHENTIVKPDLDLIDAAIAKAEGR